MELDVVRRQPIVLKGHAQEELVVVDGPKDLLSEAPLKDEVPHVHVRTSLHEKRRR